MKIKFMNISYIMFIRVWETLAVINDHGEMSDFFLYIYTNIAMYTVYI